MNKSISLQTYIEISVFVIWTSTSLPIPSLSSHPPNRAFHHPTFTTPALHTVFAVVVSIAAERDGGGAVLARGLVDGQGAQILGPLCVLLRLRLVAEHNGRAEERDLEHLLGGIDGCL